MNTLSFLKPYSEINLNVDEMPVKERDRVALAIWFCKQNGPIPGECLQVGLMILRSLNRNSFMFTKSPTSFVFEAVLEWVKECSPEQAAVDLIVCDLRQCYILTSHTFEQMLKAICEERTELTLASARIPTGLRSMHKKDAEVAKQ